MPVVLSLPFVPGLNQAVYIPWTQALLLYGPTGNPINKNVEVCLQQTGFFMLMSAIFQLHHHTDMELTATGTAAAARRCINNSSHQK